MSFYCWELDYIIGTVALTMNSGSAVIATGGESGSAFQIQLMSLALEALDGCK